MLIASILTMLGIFLILLAAMVNKNPKSAILMALIGIAFVLNPTITIFGMGILGNIILGIIIISIAVLSETASATDLAVSFWLIFVGLLFFLLKWTTVAML